MGCQSALKALRTLVFSSPRARKKCHDVLLAVAAGDSGSVREWNSVHAETDAGGFGNVLQQFHLACFAIVSHAVDMVPLARLSKHPVLANPRAQTVHEDIVAPLRGVHELEALVGIARVGRKRGKVVGYRATVAIVPVGDPRECFLGGQVHGMGAATQFLRCEQDITAQLFPESLETSVFHTGSRHGCGGRGSPAHIMKGAEGTCTGHASGTESKQVAARKLG